LVVPGAKKKGIREVQEKGWPLASSGVLEERAFEVKAEGGR